MLWLVIVFPIAISRYGVYGVYVWWAVGCVPILFVAPGHDASLPTVWITQADCKLRLIFVFVLPSSTKRLRSCGRS